jgi:hypothetical protein
MLPPDHANPPLPWGACPVPMRAHGDARQHSQRPATQRALDGATAAAEQTAKDRTHPPRLGGIPGSSGETFLHGIQNTTEKAARRGPRYTGTAGPRLLQGLENVAHPVLAGRGGRILQECADQVAEVCYWSLPHRVAVTEPLSALAYRVQMLSCTTSPKI